LFLVLLRVAIGWHFLYEGTQKILSTPWGKASILGRLLPAPEGPPFTSEGYLRASSGPLAPRFRELGEVESREKLDPAKLKAGWAIELERFRTQYGFDADQKKKADEILAKRNQDTDEWFLLADNRDRIGKYLNELAKADAVEKNPHAMSYEKENARTDRRAAEADRRELVKEIDGWTTAYRDDLIKLVTPDQLKNGGEYSPPKTQLQQVDLLTMWGLTAIGLCLMLGLFTPLAALGGAGYLLGFYLSMPPWPGLPEGITEGHYLYVNKNLIELLACLVLASTPNGLWIGCDAFLFGWIGRGRRLQDEAEPNPRTERPEPQDRRKFKKR
jgi:uncharacterized membrane protein YphA (DoxX/SURF4 family)